jgi:hypothetical protein
MDAEESHDERWERQMNWAIRADMERWMTTRERPVIQCWASAVWLAEGNPWRTEIPRPGSRVFNEILAMDAVFLFIDRCKKTKDLIPMHWAKQLFLPRLVPGHGLCVLERFLTTVGLLTSVELDETGYGYARRYCFPQWKDAESALQTWDGSGDPPGEWIKEKVSGRTRLMEA